MHDSWPSLHLTICPQSFSAWQPTQLTPYYLSPEFQCMTGNPTYTLLFVPRVSVHDSQPNLHLTNYPQSFSSWKPTQLVSYNFLGKLDLSTGRKDRGRKKQTKNNTTTGIFLIFIHTHFNAVQREKTSWDIISAYDWNRILLSRNMLGVSSPVILKTTPKKYILWTLF